MEKLATIDIGTNTALLLIAEIVPENKTLRALHNQIEVVRLGKGVDKDRRITQDAVRRLLAAITNFKSAIAAHGGAKTLAVATSAMRDAENRADVIQAVMAQTGIQIEILNGEE